MQENKKIGVLTFPNSISFGATLQMYALCNAIKHMGYDAEYINYYNLYMKNEKHFVNVKKGRNFKQQIKNRIRKLLHYDLRKKFWKFEQEIPHYPAEPFSEKAELKKLNERYAGIVCGSDQVWNPDITGCDLSFFLDFCETDTKRISYAPSFGVEYLSDEYKSSVGKELQKFSALSVREEKGQRLVEELIGKKVSLVLDPTFLISKEEWILEEQRHPKAQGEYILYYTIRYSDSLCEFCKKLAEKHHMKVIWIGGNKFKQFLNNEKMIEYASDISPREWLSLIHHASYVVTNSFHGVAFSINYQKDFFVEYSSLTNSRLEQIIGMLGLESRVVNGSTDIEQMSIDYRESNNKLMKARKYSWDYLYDALNQ